MRSIILKFLPYFLLEKFRLWKKKQTRKQIENQAKKGNSITEEKLISEFKSIGIKAGDVLLVHASLSKIGHVENGPQTVINALLTILGTEGTLLMPTSPNAKYQLDYIRELVYFDVRNAPSKLGAISECFRKMPGVLRSLNATEPVCAFGKDAAYLIQGHFGEISPYTVNSPFRRICEKKGKILYLGVSFDNAGTSLHTLEDAIEQFKFPVYFDELFTVKIKDSTGVFHETVTKVHNPEQSKKRQCDGLIPLFEKENVLMKCKIGNANSMLIDANGMLESMLKNYHETGVTMYTPFGS